MLHPAYNAPPSGPVKVNSAPCIQEMKHTNVMQSIVYIIMRMISRPHCTSARWTEDQCSVIWAKQSLQGFLPGTRISTSPSSSPSLLSSWSSPKGDSPERDLRKFLYRPGPRFGYPRDSLMIASSSSSESIISDPRDGPTISPMSSSSSTSRGTRSLRRAPCDRPSPSSSDELVDKESGGLNPDSGNVGDEKVSSLCVGAKSVDGKADLAGESAPSPSSSSPAITNGFEGH